MDEGAVVTTGAGIGLEIGTGQIRLKRNTEKGGEREKERDREKEREREGKREREEIEREITGQICAEEW